MNTLERLQKLLKDRGWSEYRLSKECGLSQSTIGNIYRRNTTPSIDTLEIICKAFGITLSQFFSETDMVELTPELKNLFDGWISLTPDQKSAVQKMIDVFNS
ncbi:MAG: helix-turn-helix transcriptional regulator [Oscillospiraceae bacterium]|nr:helix-turn-helix transcriptional regulator [Oscillospiraceae bacterium]